MKLIINWIRKKPLAAFFAIAFAITWRLGFSYIAVLQHGKYLLAFLVAIATCGPALAGILVTTIGQQHGNK